MSFDLFIESGTQRTKKCNVLTFKVHCSELFVKIRVRIVEKLKRLKNKENLRSFVCLFFYFLQHLLCPVNQY